ncbi:MAG TPA: S41 family peptidase [Chloroflexota bacterium]|nr:S41 family peptidase [Chloroflexota bacterium]
MSDGEQPGGRLRAAFLHWWRVAALLLGGLALYAAGGATGWILAGANGRSEPSTAQAEAPLLWQAWNLAEAHYVDTKALLPKQMIYGAITGMLNALGDTDHTRFLSPADVKQENTDLSGQFVGIGIQVNFKNGRPVVVAPIPNSPAQRAGLRAGDVILAVNNKDTAQMTPTDLAANIRGPAGSSVQLLILRSGSQTTFSVKVQRAAIVQPAVEAHTFTVNGKLLLHIHIAQFSANADSQLRAAMQTADQQHVAGILLDLRDNPGGLLDQAIAVSSQFLSSGNILLEEGRNGVKQADPVKPGGLATKTPLAVLINQGTASAAEITAGAIEDHERGQLVGATTFGTGTVLNNYSLSDGSEVLLGTEEWLTPNGHLIWHHGIAPTQPVPLPANVAPLYPGAEGNQSGQQILQSGDAQLVQAIKDLAP